MSSFVTISARSRYKDTKVYADDEGRAAFALMEPVKEFTSLPAGSRIHRVRANEIGYPDIIAVAYYGPGFEDMGWAILYANRIIDAEREMFPGLGLVIPPRSLVLQFQARPGDGIQ